MAVERRRRRRIHPEAALGLLALLLAAAGGFSNRDQDEARRHLRELHLERGRQQLLAGDWQRSLVYLSEAYRDAEADAGLRFLVARAAAPLRGGKSAARHSVTLAAAAGKRHEAWLSADFNDDWTRLIAVDAGGEAAVFDPRDGRRLVRLADAPPDLTGVRFSPDGERVAGVHRDGRLSLWRHDTGELLLTRVPPTHQAPGSGTAGGRKTAGPAMAFFAGGRRLLTATSGGAVRIWDPADGTSLASFETGSGSAFAFGPDGRRLVTVAGRTAMIWNLDTGKPVVSLDLPRDATVHSLAYSPDGRRILTAGRPPEVRLFDAATGELEALLSGHTAAVRSAAFSPGGGLILSAGDDRTARIWDAQRGRLLAALPLPAGEIIHAEYGPGSAAIATIHADGTINLQSLPLEQENPAEIRRLRRCYVPWRLVADRVATDGIATDRVATDRVATDRVATDRVATDRLLPATPDARGCHKIRPILEPGLEAVAALAGPVVAAAPAPPASIRPPLPVVLEATVSGRVVDLDGRPIPGAEIRLWREGTALRTLRHGDAVLAAAWSPDGERLVTAGRDGSARIWALAADAPVGEPMRHDGAVHAAAWSPDGERLVTASADGTVRVWPSGEPLRHQAAVRSAAWSPDGRWLTTASADGTVRLWDAATWRPMGEPLRPGAAASSVAWSPDGRRLVTASQSTVRLWETAPGRSPATPMRHPAVRFARFSPDGRQVVTASWDGSVRLWWVAPHRPFGPPSGAIFERGSLAAAWSPDGRQLATAGWDGVLRSWHFAERTDRVLGRHEAPVYDLAWSPDGRWLATASEDGTARIWSAQVSAPSQSEPDADPLRRLLRPVATTDRNGEARIEVDRARRSTLLVSHPGYHTPPAYLLAFATRSSGFVAKLSDKLAPSRILELLTEPAAAPEGYLGEVVSISLRNADLVETLRSFADIGGFNLLFAPGVAGTISADFFDVPWDQAFEEILRTHDLAYEPCCPCPSFFSNFLQGRGLGTLGLIVPQDGRTLAPEAPTLAELAGWPPGPERAVPFELAQFVSVPETTRQSQPPPAPASGGGVAGNAERKPRDVRLFEAQAPGEPERYRFRSEPIDMSLKNADLMATLRSFAMISDLDWTIAPDIAGTVSAELKRVAWHRALAAIVRLHDLEVEVSGDYVRIRRRDPERKPRRREGGP